MGDNCDWNSVIHCTEIVTNNSSQSQCDVPLLPALYEKLISYINEEQCGQSTQMCTRWMAD